jgi:chromosome segregation ATPase
MDTEIFLVLILFAITLTGYIQAINARTTPRVVLSYIFATLVLITSLYGLFSYIGERKVKKEQEIREKLIARMQQDSLQRIQDSLAALNTDDGEEISSFKETIKEVEEEGTKLTNSIFGLARRLEDEDEDFDVLSGRARGIRAKALEMKREVDKLKAPNDDLKDALKAAEDAVGKLVAGAGSMVAFFGAEDEDEEERYERSYRYNASEARKLFKKAGEELD